MNYDKPVITSPIEYGTDYTVGIDGKGDSLFISIINYLQDTVIIPPTGTLALTPKPSVSLLTQSSATGSVIVEGEDLNLTIHLSEPSDVDIIIDFTITHSYPFNEDTIAPKDLHGNDDIVDFNNRFISSTSDADFADTLTGQVTVLAGELFTDFTITTVNDGTLTGEVGSYRSATVTLTTQDNLGYMLHLERNSIFVLLKDATPYPLWSGKVSLWGRMHTKSYWEPIIDPSTGEIHTISIGYDDLATGQQSNRTVIIDDTPLVEIKLVTSLQLAADATGGGIDISTIPPNYQGIIQAGRRI